MEASIRGGLLSLSCRGPRSASWHGRRHPLSAILALVCSAIMAILELVSLGEVRGEQLGRFPEAVIDRATERDGIIDDLPIGLFRDGQANGTMPSRRPNRDWL